MSTLTKNLRSLNICGCDGIPVNVLLSNSLLPDAYGIPKSEWGKLSALHDIVEEYSRKSPDSGKPVTCSRDVYDAVADMTRDLDHEELWVLFLTARHKILDRRMIGCGNMDATVIDKRRIIRMALSCNAAALVLVHNHPSDDPHPSTADVRMTEELKSCCEVFDIKLLDHVIVGKTCYFSFSEERKHSI